MCEKSPVSSSAIKNATCLISENLLKKKFVISQWWNICFIILWILKIVSAEQSDLALGQFAIFTLRVCT